MLWTLVSAAMLGQSARYAYKLPLVSFGGNFATSQLTDLSTGFTTYQRRGDHGPGLEYDK